MTRYDIAIVGAGMAGASLAAELAPHARVLLLEAEAQPGGRRGCKQAMHGGLHAGRATIWGQWWFVRAISVGQPCPSMQ